MKNSLSIACLTGLLWVASIGVVSGAVITVNTGTDPIDIDWQTATIEDLPGPDGKISFSEAMIATNNTPGHDIVEFAIPESDWQMQWLYPGIPAIYSSYTYFWRAFESVTIDGTTQTAFTGDSNPDGADLILYGDDIYLGGGDSTFKGIHGGAVGFGGSNNLATGNTGGIHISLFGGSGSEIRGNECGTIKIDNSSFNTVVGNIMSRVRIWGSGGPGLPGEGNVVGGPDLADRNFIIGYGYVNSEGLPSGTMVQLASVSGTVIENNWIGTTVDGLAQGNSAGTIGIGFQGENYETIIRNNRIAGILGHGQGPHHAGQLFGWAVMIGGSGSGITITGNTIGLDANDQPLLGSVTGIDIGTWNYSSITDIDITDNVVAGHIFHGIVVGRDVAQARLSENSVFANGTLGIDLIPSGYGYGVTPNDPLDEDTGGNGLQNFPVLSGATSNGSYLSLAGSLHSSPANEFTLEFFVSPDCDGSGHGQGSQYIGKTHATTNASGDVDFEIIYAAEVPTGWVVTATATLEPLGATSEFSACMVVTEGSVAAADEEGIPARVRLLDASPNPFNPTTTLAFELTSPASALLEIFDVSGRRIRTLVDEYRGAGSHTIVWDGRNDGGQSVSSGTYFYRLSADGYTEARKMVLLQ